MKVANKQHIVRYLNYLTFVERVVHRQRVGAEVEVDPEVRHVCRLDQGLALDDTIQQLVGENLTLLAESLVEVI